ncbi:MAG: efflux RND transporter periplasmic adaptor subunit [Alphaproteobacteria bacterium]|nr:efflux RND transporter periplasmic adaptor subunit [Alphaproteobacteria bacterium]
MSLDVEPPKVNAGTVNDGASAKGRLRDAADRVAASPYAARVASFARKRPRWQIYAALVVFLLLVAALAYWWTSGSSDTASQLVVTVERGDVEDSVTALGNLQPRDYVDVGAQVSGQLKKLYVDIGDTVKSGQLLAEIDPAVLNTKVEAGRAQLKNLQATLRDKEAQLELARGQFNRQKMLKAANATSTDAYQSAESGLRSATAQVAAVKAQIAQTTATVHGDEVTLGYTKIYAPMAGTVVSVTTKQGQTINANQQAPVILRVADLSTMTVWTQVSEADVPKLRLGMDAYFTILGAPRKRWTGKLKQVLPTPEVVNNVVLYTALFDVANQRNELMTQMTAQVFFVIASKQDVLTVPVAALHRYRPRRHTAHVTLVSASGAEEDREVTVGVTNRVSAEIVSGLKEGDKVVAGTAAQSGSGQTQQRGQGRSRRPRLGF